MLFDYGSFVFALSRCWLFVAVDGVGWVCMECYGWMIYLGCFRFFMWLGSEDEWEALIFPWGVNCGLC